MIYKHYQPGASAAPWPDLRTSAFNANAGHIAQHITHIRIYYSITTYTLHATHLQLTLYPASVNQYLYYIILAECLI